MAKRSAKGKSPAIKDLNVAIPNADKWNEILDQHLDQEAQEVPEGWVTLLEVVELRDKSVTRVRSQLNALVKVGRAERKKFRVKLSDDTSSLRSIFHYKLKD